MKVVVIGCCALDVYVEIDQLPKLNEDVNTKDLKLSLGGMAYNVYNVLELFDSDAVLGCPVGEGRLADMVREMLKLKGHEPLGVIKGLDNGMCLCLVDKTRERSFISHHGAEYRFDASLFDKVDFDEVGWIYADGLEIEDVDGEKIVRFLEEKKKNVFFAPGPRCQYLDKELMKRILALKPVLHINEREAELIGKRNTVSDNAEAISEMTDNTVIITLGEKGTLLKEKGKPEVLIPTTKVEMVDATGAGDNHAGSVLACLSKGMDCQQAIRIANKVSGAAVMQKGADLSRENFEKAMEACRKENIL